MTNKDLSLPPSQALNARRLGRPGPPAGAAARCYCAILPTAKMPVVCTRRLGLRGRWRQEKLAWSSWAAAPQRQSAMEGGCLLVRESLTLWLATPLTSAAKAARILPALLDVQLPFPLESCYYRVVEMRRAADGTIQALAVVCRRENLQARLAAYTSLGVNPVLLDHEGLALWTQSQAEHAWPTEAFRAILYLDANQLTLVIGRGDQYQNAFSMLASSTPGWAAAEVTSWLQRVLRSALPAAAPLHWLLCGPDAAQAAAANTWHQPLEAEWPGTLHLPQEPETFLLRALGMRAVTRGPLRCNLRLGAAAHPWLGQQRRRQALITGLLLLVAGLLLSGSSNAWRWLTARRIAKVNRAIASLAADLAPGTRVPYGQEALVLRNALAVRAEQEAAFLEILAPPLSARLSALLSAGSALGVAYETLRLRPSGFLLTGTSADWDWCAQLAAQLEALGYTVQLERREALTDSLVHFTIQGELLTP